MKNLIYTLILINLITVSSYASHLRTGYIRVEQLSSSTLTCRITILVYTNSGSGVNFGGSADNGKDFILDFGDGTKMEVPETSSIPRPDLGNNIGVASFVVEHTYAGLGSYRVSYNEPSRNAGILNMQASSTFNFYVETFFVLDVGHTYASPKSLLPPIFIGPGGQLYSESMAQVDIHDNQLIYQMVTPQSDRMLYVSNYKLPENFSIDPISGLIQWDAKFNGLSTNGEYAFAVKTYQLRSNRVVGYMIRDFQIIIEDGEDTGDVMEGTEMENGRVYTPENSTIELRIDAGSTTKSIDLEITSALEDFPQNFSYVIEDSVHDETNYKVAKISFTNSSAIVRTNPYIITGRAKFIGVHGSIKKDISYVVATEDIFYEVPLILNAEEEVPSISVHPNPIQNFLQIDNPEQHLVLLTLFDLNGKTHFHQAIADSIFIDVSTLPSGMYICKMMVNGKMVNHKLIKE